MGNAASKKSKYGEDDQDSDEILEIDQESEENGVIFTACKKDPNHEGYISVNQLNIDSLPQDIANQHVLDNIMAHAGLVVRVKNEATMDIASGYVWLYGSEPSCYKCTLKQCKTESPHNVYGGILVTTNKHVIENKEQACQSLVDFFYHTSLEGGKHEGLGFELQMNVENKDLVGLKVVTHDISIIHRLREHSKDAVEAWKKIPNQVKEALKSHAIVISHPHGQPKAISFGELKQLEKHDTKDKGRLITGYTASTCRGSSGAPVLTGYYVNRPFVHSSALPHLKLNVSYSY